MALIIPGKDPRGDAELVAAIRSEIEGNGGSIPFARFMTQALQHPARGYYRRGRTRAGHGGDFLTSPESHPAFGGAIARQLEVFGEILGAPATWIEAGAGAGTLANQVRAGGMDVIAVDTSSHVHDPDEEPGESPEGARTRGQRPRPLRVRSDSLPFRSITGGIYANELLDAFPVHRLKLVEGRWRELFVTLEGDRFAWTERDPSQTALEELERAVKRGARPSEGAIFEVCPSIGPWLLDAARVVERGFVLLVDYGDDTPALYARGSTLRCFASHSIHHDPFVYVGTQDMTASVDFGAVVEHARRAGFEAVAYTDQRAWLSAWGVPQSAAELPAKAERGEMRADDAERNAKGIAWLCDPAGLGRVKVLALAKGVRPTLVPGLVGEVPESRRFRPETLPLLLLPDPFADLY